MRSPDLSCALIQLRFWGSRVAAPIADFRHMGTCYPIAQFGRTYVPPPMRIAGMSRVLIRLRVREGVEPLPDPRTWDKSTVLIRLRKLGELGSPTKEFERMAGGPKPAVSG